MSNYEVQAGTLVEGFETVGDWTLIGTGASIAADTVNFKTGSQGITEWYQGLAQTRKNS